MRNISLYCVRLRLDQPVKSHRRSSLSPSRKSNTKIGRDAAAPHKNSSVPLCHAPPFWHWKGNRPQSYIKTGEFMATGKPAVRLAHRQHGCAANGRRQQSWSFSPLSDRGRKSALYCFLLIFPDICELFSGHFPI